MKAAVRRMKVAVRWQIHAVRSYGAYIQNTINNTAELATAPSVDPRHGAGVLQQQRRGLPVVSRAVSVAQQLGEVRAHRHRRVVLAKVATTTVRLLLSD